MPRYDASSPTLFTTPPTDPHVASLAGTYQRWNTPTLTYSFPMPGALWDPRYPSAYATEPPHTNFTGFTAAMQDHFRFAMSKWADLINLPIVEVADGVEVGDIRAAHYGTAAGYVGFAWTPEQTPWGGDVWLSPGTAGYRPGFEAGWPHPVKLMLHEIGHALGLTHPTEGAGYLPPELDDMRYTVMTLRGSYNFEPTTPMLLDILAIQYLYGANRSTRAGNDTYQYDDSRIFHETIWDGGGVDTIAYTGPRNAKINLNEAQSSRVGLELRTELAGQDTTYDNVWIAYGVTIENARGGAGNDFLIGNAGANRLEGGAGGDHLSGMAGDDLLVGGAGEDLFEFSLWGNGEDTIEDFGSGDRIRINGAQLSGTASSGNGATVGRFEVQCSQDGGYTLLRIGTNAEPGAEVSIRLAGSIAPERFALDGELITVRIPGETRTGTTGADWMSGTAGDDLLDAGAGLDTLACTGPSTAYTVLRNAQGATISGAEGRDTLINIERIRFSDGLGIALDVDGNAGQAYRLYKAAFDRTPDLPGLGYQMNDLDQGWALTWVAGNFIASPEFQWLYGTGLSDSDFVTRLYWNVLDRNPEPAGHQYHIDRLAAGASRADVLVGFSESPENQANVIGEITNGMLYVPLV